MQLKDMYSKNFLQRMAQIVQSHYPSFNQQKFISDCLNDQWEDLKLMQRSDAIVQNLHEQLPANFTETSKILEQVGPNFTGLTAVCLPNYVAKYGLDDWSTSMKLLYQLTLYSTAEFAIRPFLVKYPQATQDLLLKWSTDSNIDVRRLASEGMRPRLPWGIRLKQYVNDPAPIMPILEQLIHDDQEYVQKSVANNLNDISKDHPKIVIAFAKKYWDQSKDINWILNRGLRTLFKAGQPEVLQLLGYDPKVFNSLKDVTLDPISQTVELNQTSTLNYRLQSTIKQPINIYIGYRVHYIRLNKTDSFKDFFIKKFTLKSSQTINGDFNIKWKQLTTRKLYPGIHKIDLLVNTTVVATSEVNLQFENNQKATQAVDDSDLGSLD